VSLFEKLLQEMQNPLQLASDIMPIEGVFLYCNINVRSKFRRIVETIEYAKSQALGKSSIGMTVISNLYTPTLPSQVELRRLLHREQEEAEVLVVVQGLGAAEQQIAVDHIPKCHRWVCGGIPDVPEQDIPFDLIAGITVGRDL